MRGTLTIPFSGLFADTLQAHGMASASKHYQKRGMSLKEFRLWCRITYKVAI